jgi:hypothetical protein
MVRGAPLTGPRGATLKNCVNLMFFAEKKRCAPTARTLARRYLRGCTLRTLARLKAHVFFFGQLNCVAIFLYLSSLTKRLGGANWVWSRSSSNCHERELYFKPIGNKTELSQNVLVSKFFLTGVSKLKWKNTKTSTQWRRKAAPSRRLNQFSWIFPCKFVHGFWALKVISKSSL